MEGDEGPSQFGRDRVAVVVNGNAKQVTADVVDVLDQIVQTGDLFVSRSLAEGREIARTIVARGYPTVLTGGGDGTFVQMVSWVVEAAEKNQRPVPRFGLLRLGTGNALAWVLGAQHERKGRGVVADLARMKTEGGSRDLRLLEIGGRLTPFAGIGADASAIHHFTQTKEALRHVPGLRRLGTGALAYGLAIATRTMPEYLVRPRMRIKVTCTGEPAFRLGVDGQPIGVPIRNGELLYDGTARMVAMSTIPYWGFGARIFPFAEDRDDRYSLRIVDISSVDVAMHLGKIWNGTYRSDRVHDFLADRIRVECSPKTALQIGGDAAGEHTQVDVGLSQRRIRVVDYYSPPRARSGRPPRT